MKIQLIKWLSAFVLIAIIITAFKTTKTESFEVKKGTHISLIGGNLGSRMLNYGYFETEMNVRYPDNQLFIRNMCDGGDTPGFRPHSSKFSPWAFPGAEKFQTEYAANSGSEGHFENPDQWLSRLKTDIIVAFFGYSESFQGKEGLQNYKAELNAFINHTLQQNYNGANPPQLAIVSPIAFEDLSALHDLPNGKKENENLLLYTLAMKEVVAQHKSVIFVDAFTPSQSWYASTSGPLTIDGSQLNDAGYQKMALLLTDKVFGKTPEIGRASCRERV